ncbi:hypothetical protein HMPREF1376_01117 [Enterococcus faecium R446]|nr:hypothetical protein HMPREF1376_01117 [Enterococcus faecium R446]
MYNQLTIGISSKNDKYEKLFLFGCSYYLMQDGFFTTSDINGVQKPVFRY